MRFDRWDSTRFAVLTLLIIACSCTHSGDGFSMRHGESSIHAERGTETGGLDLSALRGQFVVLEFWGTFCAPCIAAIPHWNELVDEFASKNVRFISVSHEDRKTIERFVRRRPIKGQLVVDTDRTLFTAYDIVGLPTTIILDRDGAVLAVTDPGGLTAEAIDDLLEGKPVEFPAALASSAVDWQPPAAVSSPDVLYEFRIARCSGEQGRSSTAGDGWWEANGWTLRQSIALACNLDERRVDIPDSIADTCLTMRIQVPRSRKDVMGQVILNGLSEAFDIVVERNTTQVDAYALTLPEGPGQALHATAASDGSAYTSSKAGAINGVNQSIGQIARILETLLGVPILDESGNTDRFDFEFRFAENDLKTVPAVVYAQLGLELTPTRRSVDIAIVRPRS